jgi:hypothetical protein
MGGFEQTLSAFQKNSQSFIKLNNIAPDMDEFGRVIFNSILDRDEPKTVKGVQLFSTDFQRKIFNELAEISESFVTLENIEVLLSRFPQRQKQISKSRFLLYHVQNYLNEVYILRERLVNFQKKVIRHSKEQRASKTQLINGLSAAISLAFSPITEPRGKHVHERRFADTDISRLLDMEMLFIVTDQGMPEFSTLLHKYYDQIFKEVRKTWISKIHQNNKSTKEFLDVFFEKLYPFLFDENGLFIT